MRRTGIPKDSFRTIRTICAILAGVILFGLVGNMDFQEEERQHAEYCEMVKLWKQTNGQRGWPDYDGIYDTACRLEEQNG